MQINYEYYVYIKRACILRGIGVGDWKLSGASFEAFANLYEICSSFYYD
jgi:hypothetical protein